MKIVSRSLEETERAAKNFLDFVGKGTAETGSKCAQIAGLFGDLGAGKTTFVQAVGRILGVKEVMTSPTFVIMKSYEMADLRLVHIDAYRLQGGEELMKLNFAEVAKDPKNLILIEWPENVASALPENYHKIYFKFVDEKTREIKF